MKRRLSGATDFHDKSRLHVRQIFWNLKKHKFSRIKLADSRRSAASTAEYLYYYLDRLAGMAVNRLYGYITPPLESGVFL
jgi:hypothetical protein